MTRLWLSTRSALVPVVTLSILVALGSYVRARGETEEVVTRPRLYWENGDTLDGRIVSANGTTLDWSAEAFGSPLSLTTDKLHMIRFPSNGNAMDPDDDGNTQIIETREGNRFFGQVTDSDDEFVNVDTDLFGPIRIQRESVSLIANPVERAHVYSGPKGLRGWSTLTYGRKLSEWEEIASGRLMTRMVAAELFRSLPAKGSVDIDIELLWRSNPSFQIRFLTPFAKPTKETIKVETRVGGFVLQTLGSNGRFRQVDTIPKEAKKCQLLLRWNHTSGELTVFRDRKYLGKISVKRQKENGNAGIFLKNTGPQLTLSRLEVRASSSLDLRFTDPTKDTILKSNNKSVSGEVTHVGKDGLEYSRGGKTETLKWTDVAEVAFRAGAEFKKSDAKETECVFQNGETLQGKIIAADKKSISLKVPSIDRAVKCRFGVLERIFLGQRSLPPVLGASHVKIGEKRLHGQLADAGDGRLGWLPVGGVKPVTLSAATNAMFFLRGVESSTVGGPQDDLIYLRNGDVLPCKVDRATPEQLTIDSKLVEQSVVSAEDIHAVELSVEAVTPLEGFDDRWRFIRVDKEKGENGKPSATIGREAVRFTGSAELQRDDILYGCDQVAFQLHHKVSEGGLFMHFGLKGTEGVEDKSIPFYFMDDKLFVLGSKRNAFIPCDDKTGRYDVIVETHDPFRVVVNGKEVYSIPRDENGGPWSGLSFDVSDGPLFGPPLRAKKKEVDISIKKLRLSQTKRASIRQSAGAIDAAPILTIPRNRTKDSLTHLAIGSNNDAVRGNLVELGDEDLHLRSKEADIRLARNSVAGLIWLHGEDENSDEKADKGSDLSKAASVASTERATDTTSQEITRIVLKDTTTISLLHPAIHGDQLSGQHPTLGACTVPLSKIQSILTGTRSSEFHKYPFLSWQTRAAREPDFATSGSDGHRLPSPLVGNRIKLDAKMLETRDRLELKNYRGKVVVLDFWASWCAPCIRNMPRLIDAIDQFPKEQVQLIAVNQGEDLNTVRAVVESKQWNLLVATDLLGSATQSLSIEALPQTVVLDQQGNVTAVYIGASTRLHEELQAEIKSLLGE